jgi:hypothetical protein
MTQETSPLDVCGLTDAELLCGLQRLARADRALNVKLLMHLGELDARGVCREQAYGSTHEYAVKALHMSDAEAYLRLHAARLGRRFARVLELFGQGELHLTAIKLIGPILTNDNHLQVLERVRGKSKREIELLVAELAPRPDVPARVRKLPSARQPSVASTQTALAPSVEAPAELCPAPITAQASSTAQATFTLQAPRPRASCTPLRPGRFRLELTLGQAAHDKLEQVRELLRHQVPNGDLSSLVERALDALLEQTMKRRFAQTKTKAAKKPHAVKRTGRQRKLRSRYIPHAVLREVHARDGGQCAFVSAEGRRCAARGFLEMHHHDVPFARGGESTAQNLRLMCRAHNALLADKDFGRDFIRAKQQREAESDSQRLAAESLAAL